jgi:phosphoribosylglycinamide formyltransferase 1
MVTYLVIVAPDFRHPCRFFQLVPHARCIRTAHSFVFMSLQIATRCKPFPRTTLTKTPGVYPLRTARNHKPLAVKQLRRLHARPLRPRPARLASHTGYANFHRLIMTKHIGILLSGRGSNFEALADSIDAGRIPDARIALVISNREGAPGLDRAAARKIPTRVIPSKGLEREAYDRQAVAALQEARVELVCLAGFMRLLSPYFVQQFHERILNIHPSLLPSFPGLEAQRQALEYGVKFSGCTVHFVDENLDAGPIVAQAIVPIEPGDTPDTLASRILAEEHRIYTEAVRLVLSGQYRVEGRRVLPTSTVQGKA